MTRAMAVRLAMIAALFWGQAHAIGLGEISLNSALNEKLDAEIELLDTRGMQPNEIIAQLASSEDFERVGVERFFYLTEMRFKVEQRGGRTFLKIGSANPVTEPYLNFLVQIMWPNGRLLKEYTVLLDPPAFTDRSAPAVAAPGRPDPGGGPAGRVERGPVRPDSQVSLTPRPTAPVTTPQNRLQDGSYGMTDRDDTLWTIAMRARSGDATVQQTMLAIVRLNPDAFIGGNVNLLKAGYVLRLPDEADAVSVAQADAIAAVAEHNQAWEAYRRGDALASVADGAGSDAGVAAQGATRGLAGQVDATGRQAAAQSRTSQPEGELRILAGEAAAAGGTSTGGDPAQVEALEAQLAATEEEVERINRELSEVAQQRDQVQAAAEQARRQIEVRDQEIAQLQARLAEAQATTAEAPTAASEKAAAPESTEGLPALLASPVVLIGGGAVLVILLVASLFAMRRKRAAAQEEDELPVFRPPSRRPAAAPVSVALAEVAGAESDDERSTVADFDADQEDDAEGFDKTRVAARTVAREAEEHEGAQTSDVIGEADIYIAYGRYPQAVNLLLGALDEDPNRSDVRLKLLEVYAETRDADGFQTQMSEFETRCDDNEMLLEARELESKFREDEVPTAVQTAAREAPATPTLSDEEFDLDLDRLGDEAIQEALDEAPPSEASRRSGGGDDLGGDLGIDFDPDADDRTVIRSRNRATNVAPTRDDESEVAVMDDGEPEFDLEDLEFDDKPVTGAAVKPATDNGDDAFDFLDEEDTASTKLDLARAYIDMGDNDGAREILAEVRDEGSAEQRKQAEELLAKIG